MVKLILNVDSHFKQSTNEWYAEVKHDAGVSLCVGETEAKAFGSVIFDSINQLNKIGIDSSDIAFGVGSSFRQTDRDNLSFAIKASDMDTGCSL
jgi:hypothetical protein